MFDQEDSDLGVVIGVLFGVIALVIALVVGVAVYQSGRNGGYASIQPVGDPAIGMFFGDDIPFFPPAALRVFDSVLKDLEENPEAVIVISGFLDASDDAGIARERSLTIKNVLIDLGVEPERILVRKPERSPRGSSDKEARRVELRVQ